MTKKTLEIEAETLEEAGEQLQSMISEGVYLISTQVISYGSPRTIKAIGDTAEIAFTRAQTEIPAGTTILDKKELSPERIVIPIEAFSDQEARKNAEWTAKMKENATIRDVKLIRRGSKGLVGIGKKPNYYEAELIQQAIVEITYKPKAKILAELGDQTDVQIEKLGTALKDACNEMQQVGKKQPTDRGSDDQYEYEYSMYQNAYKHAREKVDKLLALLVEARAIEPLLVALKDSNGDVKIAAAEALGQIGDVRAVEPLVSTMLNHGDSRMRSVYEAAANALIKIDNTHAAELFADALSRGDETVRRTAIKSLSKIGDASAADLFITALGDVNPGVRYEAVQALGNIGDVQAVEPLIAALGDHAIYVRRAAAEALGNIGDARAEEPLRLALNDWDQYEIRYLRDALNKLHPKN